MTNQQKFIEVFGIDAWKQMIVFKGLDEQFKEFWESPYMKDTIDLRGRGMTREEAIEVLSQDLPCEHDTDLIEALRIAIKALEHPEENVVKIILCGDTISRQAVYNIIEKEQFKGDAIAEIEKLPSAEKTETVTEFADRCRECGKRYVKRQTGKWIWNVEKGYCKCSECGIGMGHKEFDFCPNCGADMRGTENE